MKLLLDQNISFRVVKLIGEHFSETSSVKDNNLTNAGDSQIWSFAKENGYAIVTFDEDFYNIQLLRGFPPKIIWFKTGNLSNQQLADFMIAQKPLIESFLTDEIYLREGCLELFVLTANK